MTDMPHLTSERRLGALLMALSGVLHLPAPLFGGFDAMHIGLGLCGLAYIALSFAQRRSGRWLAYLVFLLMLAGAVAAYAASGCVALPMIVIWGIIAFDLGAALALMVDLWSDPAPR